MSVLALTKKLGVRLSRSTLRSALQALDLTWGRPRLKMPAKVDPQKAAKQWAIAQAVVEAGPEAALLYADESRLALLPLIGDVAPTRPAGPHPDARHECQPGLVWGAQHPHRSLGVPSA